MSCIVEIALSCPLRQTFDYLSDDLAENWQTGMRVSVPFGSRQLIGIVIAIKSISEQTISKLKKIDQKLDHQAFLPNEIMQLVQWVSRYYHHPIGECFQAALPKRLRLGDADEMQMETYWSLAQPTNTKPGKKQQHILNLLEDYPEGLSEKALRTQLGNVKSSLSALQAQNSIKASQKVALPLPCLTIQQAVALNNEQKQAVEIVLSRTGEFSTFLLQGITGSGKTEVYIEICRELIEKQQQILVLIPEIGLTTQFVERFRQSLNARIVVIHSAVSDTDRKQAWLLSRAAKADIIIGTRSAVFTPMLNPSLIIIDEEHDSSYKQQDGLRYHARNVALMRAKTLGIPIVLGSATPSLETLYQVKQQRYQLLKLTQRAGGANLPAVRVIAGQNASDNNGLSSHLIKAIKKHIEQNHQVLLFINRRGFAPVLMCHQCHWQANCRSCDAKMVVHQYQNRLFCHHCGLIQTLPTKCPECGHPELKSYGVGTEKIEQALTGIFPDVPVLRIDRDSTQRVNAFANMIKQINQGKAAILVGTQMLAKGHDFHDVTLVGVVDADQALFSADFRATESLAQLITQVTGRAGRGKKAGEVLIQTEQPDHPFWQNLLQKGYEAVADNLLSERIQMELPPHGFWAVWRGEAKEADLAMQLLQQIAELLQQTASSVVILGPVPALMEKRAGRYRAQLLMRSADRAALHQLIDQHILSVTKLKLARKVRWSIDIDPTELI
ncbi:primosomal protein N' [Methylophaga pinxianii]|uniref:primosomal protein N' n=1 Tax=Methylophaga pinxianii TaxID=2881052 RepID=UPI001CF2C37F|nr:primosomal protein N' [Methylophaga pinxianii]MCB2426065.1 primosomal protein N' [Methylophaga pinxianii]UPH45976.1 primosomal protein N' [Methylophaga pinxianii]